MKKQTTRNPMILLAMWWVSWSAAWGGGPGVIKMDQDSITVSESSGTAMVAVERSQGDDGEVSVVVSTREGSAMAGADFGDLFEVLTWASGDGSTKLVEVVIFEDGETEGDEDFFVVLADPSGGATVDPAREETRVIISESGGGTGDDDGDDDGDGDGDGDDGDDNDGDDDGEAGRVKFDQRTFFASEAGGVAVITVERSGGESGAITVDYITADGSATSGEDYLEAIGTLSWEAGDESSKVFMIDILGDDLAEGDETVELELFNPTGGAVLDDERSAAILTIVDVGGGDGAPGDGAGELEFEPEDVQVIEGSGDAVVRVKRSHGTQGVVSVTYATEAGSATEGEDYLDAMGTLEWADGEGGMKEFTVPILDDDIEEGNETVHLVLSDPTGGAVLDDEDHHGTLTLLDNDGSTAECVPTPTTSCLLGNRFQVRVVWRTRTGQTGEGRVQPATDQSTLFTFFSDDNVELLVKVLDGCGVAGLEGYWVFTAGLTNIDYTLEVTDTRTGVIKEYSNLLGEEAQPVQDVLTFRSCG